MIVNVHDVVCELVGCVVLSYKFDPEEQLIEGEDLIEREGLIEGQFYDTVWPWQIVILVVKLKWMTESFDKSCYLWRSFECEETA